ncbi:MAG: IS200/IS605 family transposase [Proteobacteria bacterium]|nr:IS200/IS605 family transposase [Pseudomonadota bacterium]
MANTYTQLYTHYVFAVHSRECLILPEWQQELYQYIIGIVRNRKQHVMAVGGVHDHVHLFVSMNPTISASSLMADVKRGSSKWVNDHRLVRGRFAWQEGFGAFSYAKSQSGTVIRYINNQEEHHRNKTFREEYIDILEEFDVLFDERYIFNDV